MLNTIDKSGELRSVLELNEALVATKQAIIKMDFNSPLSIHLTVIKDALIELIAIRKFMSERKSDAS